MIYADTSFWMALRFRQEQNHSVARKYFEDRQQDGFVWSPWNRVETFNSIRQLALAKIPLADARQAVYFLKRDVRLGYYSHREKDWRDVLRTADEISFHHAFSIACRGGDLLHVAYAVELAVETFVTFDDDQFQLAQACGLNAEKP